MKPFQKGELYKKLEGDNLIQCVACARKCIIKEGEYGFCGVRYNHKGDLYLTVMNRPTAVNIDPIEKKPLFHFYPTTTAFSIGTIGCNFTCTFCQNWDLSQVRDIEDAAYYELKPSDVVEKCLRLGIKSIAYTYNEPTIFSEYAVSIAKEAKKVGIKNVYVSNGYQSKEAIEYLSKYIDAINIDLKAFTNKFYRKIVGASLRPVLDSIKMWVEHGVWVEVTTLIIPDENDSDKELRDIAEFLAGVSKDIPWHISAYYDAYKMKGKNRTPLKTLLRAYKIGKEAGLRYVYTGNVSNPETEKTVCPSCGQTLVARNWYNTEIVGMNGSRCSKCGEEIAGVWED